MLEKRCRSPREQRRWLVTSLTGMDLEPLGVRGRSFSRRVLTTRGYRQDAHLRKILKEIPGQLIRHVLEEIKINPRIWGLHDSK